MARSGPGGETAAGRRIERVRIITVPHVDYTRWGLSFAPLHIEARERLDRQARPRMTSGLLPTAGCAAAVLPPT
ncbi:DUF6879 family protein [Paractinoplanes ovalisporus]|uniref:DUF6879 family protein n=1 Tax=Paractinoplanes ovalisporus TaxID=2810368 RepID=UPI0034DB7732